MVKEIEALIQQLQVAGLAAKAVRADSEIPYHAERYAECAVSEIYCAIESLSDVAKALEGL